MTWPLRGWRSPGDDDARLDALLAGTWNAAAEAAGKVLDIQAGKEALMAGCGQQQPPGTAGSVAPRDSLEVPHPPALKKYRQPRRQRRTARVLAAVGVVAVLTAGALTAADLTRVFGAGGSQQIQTAAYITRVKYALATQAEEGLVGYTRTVFPPGTVIEQVGVNSWQTLEPASSAPSPRSPSAAVMVTWNYQDSEVDAVSTATGQPVFADQITTTARELTEIEVSYRDASWWRAAQTLNPDAQGPAPGCSHQGYPDLASSGWPAYIRQELSCGVYHLDGRQRVDGIDAVKLTGDIPGGRLVLWIDPATYLPVRETDSGGPPGAGPVQIDFRWFPVTAASLAHLKVSVPASFRQVQPPPAR
jgi:hypothetical protein